MGLMIACGTGRMNAGARQRLELAVPGAIDLRVEVDRSLFILPKPTPRSNIGTLVFRYAAAVFDAQTGRIGFR